eukprot:gene6756-4848_t
MKGSFSWMTVWQLLSGTTRPFRVTLQQELAIRPRHTGPGTRQRLSWFCREGRHWRGATFMGFGPGGPLHLDGNRIVREGFRESFGATGQDPIRDNALVIQSQEVDKKELTTGISRVKFSLTARRSQLEKDISVLPPHTHVLEVIAVELKGWKSAMAKKLHVTVPSDKPQWSRLCTWKHWMIPKLCSLFKTSSSTGL